MTLTNSTDAVEMSDATRVARIEEMFVAVDPSCGALARHLWASIPASGRPISNRTLRKLTRTKTNGDYAAARNALRAAGLIEYGGGRSGSVRRSMDVVDDSATEDREKGASFELSLYGEIVSTLKEMMTDDQRFDGEPVVCRTGVQGRRRTGGIWTRPDITAVAFKKFKVLAGGHLEVHTYEVKTGAGFDITALHEARSHRRTAHRSYVLVDWDDEADLGRIESLIDEARDLGVGLMSFRSVKDDWHTWYDPPINFPDPIELDDFLATQLPVDEIDRIKSWSASPALGGTD